VKNRSISAEIVGYVIVLCLMVTAYACTPLTKTIARTAIDVAQATCIVANSDKSDAEVKAICGIVDALDGPMRDLLKSSREQVRHAREQGEWSGAVRCHFAEKDAGQ
jgi:hypothetical protein